MIRTSSLDLVPADRHTARAALEDNRERLAELLDARVPKSWPPELLDPPALEWVLRMLDDPAHDPRWGMYWIVLRDEDSRRALVGTAGFKGRPRDGTVEIGYGVIAEYQRRGIASETTRALLEHAFAHPAVDRVIAETLPGLLPSIGVLEKCGFTFIGEGSEPGVIRYEVVRT